MPTPTDRRRRIIRELATGAGCALFVVAALYPAILLAY